MNEQILKFIQEEPEAAEFVSGDVILWEKLGIDNIEKLRQEKDYPGDAETFEDYFYATMFA
tara:strand:- start:72 stop:254 length:183 start_codon:yes stop_codon:yes gene_type:complete